MATKKKMLQAAAGNAGGAGLDVEEVFSTYLYEGNSSTQTITNGIDLDGEGGLVWSKRRSSGNQNILVDTERGAGNGLRSNATSASISESSVIGFNSDGYDLGSESAINYSGSTNVSWTFRKAPKFFTCVTWSGDGTGARTISHNLGATVGALFMKATNAEMQWFSYHNGLTNQQFLELNATTQAVSSANAWNNTTPTSTEFSVGSYGNISGRTYVAYLFAHNDGDGEFGADGDADIIKCGSYVSNETSPPEITLGFEPQWILIKKSTGADEWAIFDNMRGVPTDGNDAMLRPNLTNAEYDAANQIDFTSTGFKLTTAGLGVTNAPTGETYIYIAIRRGTKVPESATEVFAMDTLGGTLPNPPGFYSGWPVDLALITRRAEAEPWTVYDRLRGPSVELRTNDNSAEQSATNALFDQMNGYYEGGSVVSDIFSWMWKRAPGYFDVVGYTGNGTAGRTVSHNLTVAPEMIWVKSRSAGDNWYVYHKDLTSAAYALILNSTTAQINAPTLWNSTTPTDSVFTVGSDGGINGSTKPFIAYLFATLPGISKVGSYTGNGSSQTIDCGFTSGARFILVKRTDSTGDWYVWDTERGIVTGNDPYLELNTTDAEVTSTDWVDPDNSGFIVNGTTINASSASYIFYAIA